MARACVSAPAKNTTTSCVPARSRKTEIAAVTTAKIRSKDMRGATLSTQSGEHSGVGICSGSHRVVLDTDLRPSLLAGYSQSFKSPFYLSEARLGRQIRASLPRLQYRCGNRNFCGHFSDIEIESPVRTKTRSGGNDSGRGEDRAPETGGRPAWTADQVFDRRSLTAPGLLDHFDRPGRLFLCQVKLLAPEPGPGRRGHREGPFFAA